MQTCAFITSIYLDFVKAFDKVDHNILLAKLRKLNIRGKLIRESLNVDSCVSETENALSDPVNITTGVPQGSVLASLPFIIMMTDIDDCIE